MVGALSLSSSEMSVLQRVWHGLLGGAGYRRLAADSSRVYPAFLLVAGTTSLVLSIVVAVAASRGLSAVAAAWPRLPNFNIANGALVLSSHVATPVRVSADGALLVLDPNQPASAAALGQARYGVALTAADLVVRLGRAAGGDSVIPLSVLGAMSKTQLGALIGELAHTGVWLRAAFDTIYGVLRDLVDAAVVAWLGMLLIRVTGRQLSWPQAWRVGLAAWTLPMVAEACGVAFGVPQWSLWLVAGAYTITGGLAAATTTTTYDRR